MISISYEVMKAIKEKGAGLLFDMYYMTYRSTLKNVRLDLTIG
ncbi:hypothetical protein M2263_001379 [Providencia alcalifaciens]|nr:hypothetical protein [Providencia alcalifaciens]